MQRWSAIAALDALLERALKHPRRTVLHGRRLAILGLVLEGLLQAPELTEGSALDISVLRRHERLNLLQASLKGWVLGQTCRRVVVLGAELGDVLLDRVDRM